MVLNFQNQQYKVLILLKSIRLVVLNFEKQYQIDAELSKTTTHNYDFSNLTKKIVLKFETQPQSGIEHLKLVPVYLKKIKLCASQHRSMTLYRRLRSKVVYHLQILYIPLFHFMLSYQFLKFCKSINEFQPKFIENLSQL